MKHEKIAVIEYLKIKKSFYHNSKSINRYFGTYD
jgi:hypothetical protein